MRKREGEGEKMMKKETTCCCWLYRYHFKIYVIGYRFPIGWGNGLTTDVRVNRNLSGGFFLSQFWITYTFISISFSHFTDSPRTISQFAIFFLDNSIPASSPRIESRWEILILNQPHTFSPKGCKMLYDVLTISRCKQQGTKKKVKT